MSPLSIVKIGTHALAAVSTEQLLALPIIKFKALTPADTSWAAVLCRVVAWPSTGLLSGPTGMPM